MRSRGSSVIRDEMEEKDFKITYKFMTKLLKVLIYEKWGNSNGHQIIDFHSPSPSTKY